MTRAFLRATSTTIAIGLIVAVVAAILYFMELPIFDAISLAWTFVVGLVAAAIATCAIAVRSIWDERV